MLGSGWPVAVAAGVTAAIQWGRHRQLCRRIERAGHEVRGPLTAAGFGLHPAAAGRGIGVQRARAIAAELDRAALAVEDLVAPVPGLARARRARRPGRPVTPSVGEPVDLVAVARDSVEAWSAYAAARGGRLELAAVRGVMPAIDGHRVRLAQALGNLIANAIEHGGGDVRVRCRGDLRGARIEVCDAGPGLPAPVGEVLADGRRGRRRWLHQRWRAGGAGRPGRGHGLAVASAVALAHGGRIAAAPSERGARIVLELPAGTAASEPGRRRLD